MDPGISNLAAIYTQEIEAASDYGLLWVPWMTLFSSGQRDTVDPHASQSSVRAVYSAGIRGDVHISAPGLEHGMLRNGGEAVICDHTSVAPRSKQNQKPGICPLQVGCSRVACIR